MRLTMAVRAGQITSGMTRYLRRSHRLIPFVTLAALQVLSAPVASAHMTVEGAGEITNGALHPLMTPAHVLVLLALGLLLGQQLPLDLDKRLRVFAPVSAVALLLTMAGGFKELHPPLLIGLALCVAILVAWERKLPRFVPEILCALAAAGISFDSAVETGTTGNILKTLMGTWLVMNAVVFYVAVCASNGAGKQWAKIGIRILGSWIIAISFMVLAFVFKKGNH